MIGEVGLALTPFESGRTGRVATRGEIWTAIATEPIAEGNSVCVTSIDGLTLTIENESSARERGAGSDMTDVLRRNTP